MRQCNTNANNTALGACCRQTGVWHTQTHFDLTNLAGRVRSRSSKQEIKLAPMGTLQLSNCGKHIRVFLDVRETVNVSERMFLVCCKHSIKILSRDSSVGIATRYDLDDPGIESRWGVRFSTPVQTGPGAQPASCTTGTGSFTRVKRPGRGVDHPPTSSAEVKERVELYLYSPYGPSWPVLGRTLPLLYLNNIKIGNEIANVPTTLCCDTSRYIRTSSAIPTFWHDFTPRERFCGHLMSPATYKPTYVFMRNARYFCPISRYIFIKVPSIKFHGNPSIGSRAYTCGRTDGHADIQTPTHGHDEADWYFCDYAKAPKSLDNKLIFNYIHQIWLWLL